MSKVSQAPGASNSLVKVLEGGVQGIRMIAASHGHCDPVPTVREEEVRVPTMRARAATPAQSGTTSFRRGQILRHVPSGRKVTVLKAGAANCEVVDNKSGRKWTASISELK